MNNKFYSKTSFLIKDKDVLKQGNCVCAIRNKNTGNIRYAPGSVCKVPYTKNASPETKKKYGKNIVYGIYNSSEEIIGFYQNKIKKI